MKQVLLLLLAVFIFTSCRKEASKSTKSNDTEDNLLLHKITYSRKDTTIQESPKIALKTNVNLSVTSKVEYVGNGQYRFTIQTNVQSYLLCNLYRNGQIYETGTSVVSPYTGTFTLPPGNYNFLVEVVPNSYSNFRVSAAYVNVVDKPIAPAGMICLYEYYNSINGQHVYTYDWEELGSSSNDYNFIKVLGYTYPSASSAPGLKPIYRYYNASTGSHYTTDLLGSYPGFIYEKVLGYVGTSATSNLSRPLTRYYNHFLDDHFVCVPPEVPRASDYVPDPIFIFGYIQ